MRDLRALIARVTAAAEPAIAISSLTEGGDVSVVGRITADSPRVCSPISGRSAVCFYVRCFSRAELPAVESVPPWWPLVFEEVLGDSFELEDHTGRATALLEGADIVGDAVDVSEFAVDSRSPQRALRYLRDRNLKAGMRIEEVAIHAGDLVALSGIVALDHSHGGQYRSAPTTCVIVASDSSRGLPLRVRVLRHAA